MPQVVPTRSSNKIDPPLRLVRYEIPQKHNFRWLLVEPRTKNILRRMLADERKSFPPWLARQALSLRDLRAVTTTSTVPSDLLAWALPRVLPAALLLPVRLGAALRGALGGFRFPIEWR